MANLLDQASIVLTPTAYDNGKVLCAKPSEPPYGDFDFSRNSAATRVNAQGLVENVQILSSNLVQNPSFSEEGVQEVSNGSFSQEGVELLSQPVNLVTDCLPNGGGVIVDANTFTTSGGTFDGIRKNSFLTIGKTYRLTIEGNTTSSGFNIGDTAASGNEYGSGFGTFYFTAVGNGSLWLRQNTSGTTNITTFSIREVGQDWSLGTGWSIGEDKVVADNVSSNTTQNLSSIDANKSYKISFNINDYSSGNFFITFGGNDNTINFNSNGDYTVYINPLNAVNNRFYLRGNGFSGSITNISVKEVGQNWNLGSGWSIGEDIIYFNNPTGTELSQQLSTTTGKYKIKFDLDLTSGNCQTSFASPGTSTIESFTTSGTKEVIIETTSNYSKFRFVGVGGSDFSITNISVIEITDDTNLPRINYEGFSYQDALGSEQVVNGDFATDSDWLFGGSASISNGSANFTGSGDLIRQNIITQVGTYKVTFTVTGTGYLVIKNYTGGVLYREYTNISQGEHTIYIEKNEDGIMFQSFGFASSIDNVSVKEYLGQEVVPDSGCGSWLWESQSTNLITYSEDFSQWQLIGGGSLVSNSVISPDGTQNASSWITNALGQKIQKSTSGLVSGNEYTFSVYIKADTNINVGIGGIQSSVVSVAVTTEWQRFEVTQNTNSDTRFPQLQNIGDSGTFYIWGAQVEANNISSYIPTSGSTVTRNQDVCTNGGSLASINSTEGTLYFEGAALTDNGLSRIISLSDGNPNNNGIKISYDSNVGFMFFQKYVNGVRTTNVNTTSIIKTDFNKIAVRYGTTEFSVFANGVNIINNADTNIIAPNTLNTLRFSRDLNTNNFFGKTKALAVWKEALSDQELADLTYPTPTDPAFALDFDTIATDFTFARGSEATYVDAQGLIQSTNELGPELITNGDFSNGSTDWFLSTGWSVVDSKLYSDNTQTNFESARQLNVTEIGKTYKLKFNLNLDSGVVEAKGNAVYGQYTPSDNGEVILFFTADSTTFRFTNFPNNTLGTIDNVSIKEYITATNTPRLDYSTGAEAFLLEPQSTNLIPYSEDFEVWNQIQNVTLISNSTISPSGENNATKFLSTTGSSKVRNNFSVVSGTTYTFSVYCKNIDATFVRLLAYDGANEFSLNVVSQINTSTWTKVSLTFTATNTSGSGQVQIARDLPDGESLYFWGAQLEEQSYATSYIPTSGTTVTRNQETCINATPEINSEEGVLYAEINAENVYSNSRYIALSDGTTSNRVIIGVSLNVAGTITCFVSSGGSTVAILSSTADITDFNKIALRYSENNFSLFLNGVKASTDTSGLPPVELNRLTYGNGVSNAQPFYGSTKDIQVYTKALSDADWWS